MNWEAAGTVAEVASALAVVVSLVYLAGQVRTSNRLARAEALRMPNSELNAVNASFGTDAAFQAAIRRVLTGAKRDELEPSERILVDYYLFSITNVYDQIEQEIRQGILDPETIADFGGKGLFVLPYYQTSWSLYREQLSSRLVADFERRYGLDPTVEAEW